MFLMMFFSSVEETNRLISKGMSSKLLRKTDVLKTTFILALSFSAVFRLQNRVSDFF